MFFDGAGQRRGHVLLIAGDAAVRRRAVQLAPSANLAALGMVPASVLLSGGLPTDTVCLDGVRDPNTVLARLRVAAATPGPLLLYVSGRLTADRRGRRLYLALAGTSASSVRYTAVPWEWLSGELRGRPAGLTTVVVDLAADREAWPLLGEYGSLPAVARAEVYGVVCPPGFAGGSGAVSGYTRHWIDQLRRAPVRPSDVQLHALAAGAAGLPPGALVVPTARELGMRPGPQQPTHEHEHEHQHLPRQHQPHQHQPQPQDVQELRLRPPGGEGGGDPRPYIHALAVGGRHDEAAAVARAWEEHAGQAYGYSSFEAVQWTEIRADLARMAGDFALATGLWTGACRVRLAGQGVAAAEVHAAAAGALYCWTQVRERGQAVESGPGLVAVLQVLPALDPRYLQLVQARLEALQAPGLPRAVRT
ncbi:hypothetical protein ACWGE1_23525 [Streptomyces sp. NPDC054932]